MITKYQVIQPDGTTTEHEVDLPADPSLREMNTICVPHIGPGEPLERVKVFWDGFYRSMFVSEMGHRALTTRGPLPINPKATEIYHNNIKVHAPAEHDPDGPTIAGVAVLFDRRIWF